MDLKKILENAGRIKIPYEEPRMHIGQHKSGVYFGTKDLRVFTYLVDCEPYYGDLPVEFFEDIKIKTEYKFQTFEFYITHPLDMHAVLNIVRQAHNLQRPEIVINESMFNRIYGIEEKDGNSALPEHKDEC